MSRFIIGKGIIYSKLAVGNFGVLLNLRALRALNLDFLLYNRKCFFILILEVVFLQFRDEMRRVNLPPTVSSIDAIKVLFMNAFPGQISMPDFEAEEKSIYIKDHETGVFFQLDDVRYFHFHF